LSPLPKGHAGPPARRMRRHAGGHAGAGSVYPDRPETCNILPSFGGWLPHPAKTARNGPGGCRHGSPVRMGLPAGLRGAACGEGLAAGRSGAAPCSRRAPGTAWIAAGGDGRGRVRRGACGAAGMPECLVPCRRSPMCGASRCRRAYPPGGEERRRRRWRGRARRRAKRPRRLACVVATPPAPPESPPAGRSRRGRRPGGSGSGRITDPDRLRAKRGDGGGAAIPGGRGRPYSTVLTSATW
jgi:hypothetical protein